MEKFKVGDKVIIKEDLKAGCEYDNGCYFASKMEKYKGKTAVIKNGHIIAYFNGNVKIENANNYRYKLDIDNGEWSWSPSMLEKFEDKKHFKSLPRDYTGTINVEKGFIVKKEILDEAEKEYLSTVIKPFKEKVTGIDMRKFSASKCYLSIDMIGNNGFTLPNFKQGTMYKNMEFGRKYTLKELGLD